MPNSRLASSEASERDRGAGRRERIREAQATTDYAPPKAPSSTNAAAQPSNPASATSKNSSTASPDAA
ncbi:MAG: hypothetical protein ACRDRO_25300 [Pseudonocardiaceae bacterium]